MTLSGIGVPRLSFRQRMEGNRLSVPVYLSVCLSLCVSACLFLLLSQDVSVNPTTKPRSAKQRMKISVEEVGAWRMRKCRGGSKRGSVDGRNADEEELVRREGTMKTKEK